MFVLKMSQQLSDFLLPSDCSFKGLLPSRRQESAWPCELELNRIQAIICAFVKESKRGECLCPSSVMSELTSYLPPCFETDIPCFQGQHLKYIPVIVSVFMINNINMGRVRLALW